MSLTSRRLDERPAALSFTPIAKDAPSSRKMSLPPRDLEHGRRAAAALNVAPASGPMPSPPSSAAGRTRSPETDAPRNGAAVRLIDEEVVLPSKDGKYTIAAKVLRPVGPGPFGAV